jgi:hypothetical protein
MLDNFHWTTFFQLWSFHIQIVSYMIFWSYVIILIRVQNLSQTRSDFGENGAFFYFTFTLYPYCVFDKRDQLLSQLIKFKYENIKLKKKNVKRNMPNI